MLYERKTKDRNMIYVIFFPIGGLIIFLGSASLFGFEVAFYIIGAIFFLMSAFPFATYWRTRNPGYLILAMFQVFVGLVGISAPAAIDNRNNSGLVAVFLVAMYVMMLMTFYQILTRKLRWRGQEVFELAAMPIEDTGGTLTSRPRPVGKVEASRTEMIRFVEFIRTNLIAFVFEEDNRFVFVLALPGDDTQYIFGLKKDYMDDTWVAIDDEGNVTVNITQEDYLLFKQDLNFDQLCQSVGDVFIEFLELSKKGQEQMIVDKMNAMKLCPLN